MVFCFILYCLVEIRSYVSHIFRGKHKITICILHIFHSPQLYHTSTNGNPLHYTFRSKLIASFQKISNKKQETTRSVPFAVGYWSKSQRTRTILDKEVSEECMLLYWNTGHIPCIAAPNKANLWHRNPAYTKISSDSCVVQDYNNRNTIRTGRFLLSLRVA